MYLHLVIAPVITQYYYSSPAIPTLALTLINMKSAKKSKKSNNGPTSHNLRSNNRTESNRASPNHNHFDAFASDDDAIPPNVTDNEQLTDLKSSLEEMNASFNKKFENMFDVLTTHQRMFSANGIFPSGTTAPETKPVPPQSVPPPVPDQDPTTPTTIPPVVTSTSVSPPNVDVKLAPSGTVPDSNSPTFGQNDFSIIVNGVTKIKYMSMENYLKDKTIENDSVQEIEKMYVDILMSLTFVFEMDLSFLPPFGSL